MPYKINSNGLELSNAGSPAVINGRNFRVEGITPVSASRVINAKLPLTADNFYQDNNYTYKPAKLVDGVITNQGEFIPADNPNNLVYHPYELVLDLIDYNTNIRKIRIYDVNGAGWDVGIFLVKDDGSEYKLGDYTGANYLGWDTYEYDTVGHTATPFKVIRIIFRQLTSSMSFGNEIEVYGDYDPYNPPAYNKPLKPLKYMLGTNAHDYNIMDNVSRGFLENRYQALLKLNPQAIRYFQEARQLQIGQDEYVFNPVRSGWMDEDLATRLRTDRPSIITWDTVHDQYDWVKALWEVPDPNNYVIATITNIITHGGGWTTLQLSSTSHVGSGTYNKWFFSLDSDQTNTTYQAQSDGGATIPTTDPTNLQWDIGGQPPYTIGMSLRINGGHRSAFNIYPQNNTDAGRAALQTWADVLGKTAYTYALRKGTNTANKTNYTVYTGNGNVLKWATNTASFGEFMNEPNAYWAGYDNFLKGAFLAAAWSVMYDGHKGMFPNCGVKQADPNFKMSISGLATIDVDLLRACVDWCRVNRGYNADGSVNLPFDYIQFHAYSYTGGISQYAGGTQGGLPAEIGNVLDAIDTFNKFSNKYAKNTPVIIGEWGWDVNQGSPMNAPPIGSYTAEQTRGNWVARALVEYAAHGLDLATWYRLAMDFNSDINNSIQFSTMYLMVWDEVNEVNHQPSVAGAYFAQLHEFGEYVFDSRISTDNPRVLKFVNPQNNQAIYIIWAVETPTNQQYWGSQKPTFTEVTGNYSLALPTNTQVKVREFVDGAWVMSDSGIQTVTNNAFPISYGAKPKIVQVTGVATGSTSYQLIGRQRVENFPMTASWDLAPALVWVPTTYDTDSTSTTYPLIFFFHGVGEAGTDLTKLINTGLPQIIANGDNVEEVDPVTGKLNKFIVVSPQHSYFSYGADCSWDRIRLLLNSVETKYRIDTTRVYVTGLSAGSQGTISAVDADATLAGRFAACCPISFTGYNCAPEKTNVPLIGSTYHIPMWTVVGEYDTYINGVNPYQLSLDLVNNYNSTSPNPLGVRSVHPGTGHDAGTWNSVYNRTYKMPNGDNFLQFFLRYHR